jgi:methionine-rich copper-binding protein CopC/putative copper export protein
MRSPDLGVNFNRPDWQDNPGVGFYKPHSMVWVCPPRICPADKPAVGLSTTQSKRPSPRRPRRSTRTGSTARAVPTGGVRRRRAARRPHRRKLAVLVALAALAVCAARAEAHPYLIQSAPAPDVVVSEAPRAITLSFTETVDAAGSRVHVVGPGGGPDRVARLMRTGPNTLTARLAGPLPTAVYDVNWVTRGADGHTVSGSFAFGVPGPHGAPPPHVDRLSAPGLRGTQSASKERAVDVAWRWLGILAAGMLLAGFVVRVRARSFDEARWRPVRAGAIAVATLATAEAVQAAAAGTGSAAWHEIVAEPRGQLALVRLGVLVALAFVLVLRDSRVTEPAVGVAGAAVLVTYAIEGHLQTVTHDAFLPYAAQIAHVTAAGLWVGGLVLLATGIARGREALRAFAWVAAVAVFVLAGTGVVAALREVRAWYFLRWSAYGNVVFAKVVLLIVLLGLAALSVRALRRGRAAGWPLRLEALGAVAVVLLASTLAGLPPGRGQLLPAQRGNLLAGASFATVSTDGAPAELTLAPARPGANTLVVSPTTLNGQAIDRGVRSVRASLSCSCEPRTIDLTLRRGVGGAWAAPVDLPTRGSWLVTAAIDGRSSIAPAATAVGDPPVRGSSPRTVLMTADLSGSDSLRCRAEAQGALLALGRYDARGGLPGGRKVALSLQDDGGDPGRAAALVRSARSSGAIALLAPCGPGAGAAVRAARGLPTLVADPAVPPVAGKHVWRTAGDPYVEGTAIGQYLTAARRGAAGRTPPPVVATISAADAGYPQAAAEQRLAGLAGVLQGAGVQIRRLPVTAISWPAALRRALDPKRYMATIVDGDPQRLGAALGVVGAKANAATLNPDQIVATSPLLDERFQLATGVLGKTGAIASPAEVVPDSADAQRYVTQMRTFFRGDQPSIGGLRGYVAGLALGEGLRDGPSPGSIAARLRRPRRFTDALIAPWRASAPQAGAPLFDFLAPSFLPANLLPPAAGGEQHSGTFFDGGAWVAISGTRPLGMTTLLH